MASDSQSCRRLEPTRLIRLCDQCPFGRAMGTPGVAGRPPSSRRVVRKRHYLGHGGRIDTSITGILRAGVELAIY